jgi:hypothetical protein
MRRTEFAVVDVAGPAFSFVQFEAFLALATEVV